MDNDTKLECTNPTKSRRQVCYLFQARGKNKYKIGHGYNPRKRIRHAFESEDWVLCGAIDDLPVEETVKQRLAHRRTRPFQDASVKLELFERLTRDEIRWLEKFGFKTLPVYANREDLDPNGRPPTVRSKYRQFVGMALLMLMQIPGCFYRRNLEEIRRNAVLCMGSFQYTDGMFLLGPADFVIVDTKHPQCSPEPRAFLHVNHAMRGLVKDGLTIFVGGRRWWQLTSDGVTWASQFFHPDQLAQFYLLDNYYKEYRANLMPGIDIPKDIAMHGFFPRGSDDE